MSADRIMAVTSAVYEAAAVSTWHSRLRSGLPQCPARHSISLMLLPGFHFAARSRSDSRGPASQTMHRMRMLDVARSTGVAWRFRPCAAFQPTHLL